MFVSVVLNPRNLSNSPQNPTYGFKIPIRNIRALVTLDRGLAHLLGALENGQMDTYTRDLTLLWPTHNAPALRAHVSYTYTGRQLTGGGYSCQAHIAVTNATWTPWIVRNLGGRFRAVYFPGGARDLMVISD